MPHHLRFDQDKGDLGPSFRDRAFEPYSSFDFDDESSRLEPNMSSLGMFQGGKMGSNMMDGM